MKKSAAFWKIRRLCRSRGYESRESRMEKTLRDKLAVCVARQAVIVWDEYLKSDSMLRSAIQKYESEANRHFGQLMIHRFTDGKDSVVLPYEWHTRFDCGMDLIVGETEILLNTYKTEE